MVKKTPNIIYKNKEYSYDTGGMVIISILMVISFLFLILTWNNASFTMDNIINYIYVHGFEALIFIFFIVIGIYCWYNYFIDMVKKPKEVVLYLKSIDEDDDDLHFIDKNNKEYIYNNSYDMFSHQNISNYKVNTYYRVLKTKHVITKIIGATRKGFELSLKKSKESFWLTYYSPAGKWENILLLPILYVIALPGVVSIFLSSGFERIYGIIYSVVPVSLIIYDLFYKIKNK